MRPRPTVVAALYMATLLYGAGAITLPSPSVTASAACTFGADGPLCRSGFIPSQEPYVDRLGTRLAKRAGNAQVENRRLTGNRPPLSGGRGQAGKSPKGVGSDRSEAVGHANLDTGRFDADVVGGSSSGPIIMENSHYNRPKQDRAAVRPTFTPDLESTASDTQTTDTSSLEAASSLTASSLTAWPTDLQTTSSSSDDSVSEVDTQSSATPTPTSSIFMTTQPVDPLPTTTTISAEEFVARTFAESSASQISTSAWIFTGASVIFVANA